MEDHIKVHKIFSTCAGLYEPINHFILCCLAILGDLLSQISYFNRKVAPEYLLEVGAIPIHATTDT